MARKPKTESPTGIAEIANVANSMAQHATASATVTGILVEALIDALLQNGSLGKHEFAAAFQKGHAYLNSRIPAGQATGISDGELFGIFLRGTDGATIGGADGWTWGGTCYIRHLFVPALMRKQGYGTRLMARIEEEAKARRCEQIVLETHDFQSPDFYRKLGFRLTGTVDGYPQGHQRLTFVKQFGSQRGPDQC
jgi:GNAT superfamily N-acetyltransferase